MKKFIIITIVFISSVSFAIDKNDLYFGPALGKHYYNAQKGLEDTPNGALRMGFLPFENIAIEGEYEFASTHYYEQYGTSVDTYQLAAVKYFNLSETYKPFILLGGAYTTFADKDKAGIAAGVGLNCKPYRSFSFDFRVKSVFYGGRKADIVPMFGVNVHFNSK